jgi:hypothetical protein
MTGPLSSLARGALCISIDLELAWGTWDLQTDERHQLCAIHEREITRRLLALFDRHEIAATWAIVGRLLERGDARWRRGGVQNWYAPDIIDAVRAARPPHEIGSHGYAHVYYPGLPPEAVDDDLAAARSVHEREGLAFRSFAFPRNAVGHTDLLGRHGLAVCRTVDAGLLHRAGRRAPTLRPATNFLDKLLPLEPATVLPRRRADGVVELESSMLLMGRNGLRTLLSPRRLAAKLRSGLRAAERERAVFHLWFHPSNFYYDPETQFALIDGVLADAARMRAEGRLEVRTMGSFAGEPRPSAPGTARIRPAD